MAYRAFVGFPLPADPAFEALAEALRASGADLKLQEPAKLHVTLAFLGDVPDDATPRLAAALDEATRGRRAFLLPLHGVGAFPNPRQPRVVWVGARASPALDELGARVREALAKAGFPGDAKPFRAHATLARVREGGRLGELPALLASRRDETLPDVPVAGVTLYRSTLGKGGATHDALHVAPLEA